MSLVLSLVFFSLGDNGNGSNNGGTISKDNNPKNTGNRNIAQTNGGGKVFSEVNNKFSKDAVKKEHF